jgi:hypothetical protein
MLLTLILYFFFFSEHFAYAHLFCHGPDLTTVYHVVCRIETCLVEFLSSSCAQMCYLSVLIFLWLTFDFLPCVLIFFSQFLPHDWTVYSLRAVVGLTQGGGEIQVGWLFFHRIGRMLATEGKKQFIEIKSYDITNNGSVYDNCLPLKTSVSAASTHVAYFYIFLLLSNNFLSLALTVHCTTLI